MTEGRVCVIYHYYEAGLLYRYNLVHFLKFGIIPDVGRRAEHSPA